MIAGGFPPHIQKHQETFMRLRPLASFLAGVALTINAASLLANTREISNAERAGVEAVAAFLEQGAEGLFDRLGSDSPLSALPRAEALAEIQTRTGPSAGSRWELLTAVPALAERAAVFGVEFPSGIDDVLTLTFTNEAGHLRLQQIHTLAEPSPFVTYPAEMSVPRDESPASRDSKQKPLVIWGGLLAAVAGLSLALVPHHRGVRLATLVTLVLFCAVTATVLWQLPPAIGASIEEPAIQKGPVRLAPLQSLRTALAQGDTLPAVQAAEQHQTNAAVLWKAQSDLSAGRHADVAAALEQVRTSARIPLTEILKARLAVASAKEIDAALAYERAIVLGPGRDSLWIEAGQALSHLGYDTRAERYLGRATGLGTREPGAWYDRSAAAAATGNVESAERHLLTGWRLRPVERTALFSLPDLPTLIRREKISRQISLTEMTEPVTIPAQLSSNAAKLPKSAEAVVAGEFLRITVGDSEIHINGGASLAPFGTPLVSADWLRREEERKGLEETPQLIPLVQHASAVTQPTLRRRVERAVEALAAVHRWDDLLLLTAGFTASTENVPTELLLRRYQALNRTGRLEESKTLALEIALGKVIERKNDADMLLLLGELLAHAGGMDETAIRLLQRSAAVRPSDYIPDRIRQIRRRGSAESGLTSVQTTNFTIQFPRGLDDEFGERIGRILEAELTRLKKRLSIRSVRRIVVKIYYWEDFISITGTQHIAGFFDGAVHMPLARVPSFDPQIVAIVSHELAHAMIAQETLDRAPHWFQEGVAQRMEMIEHQQNAWRRYQKERLYALPLLDGVFKGGRDLEMIESAYVISQTIVRFVESSCGNDPLARMMAAFREGHSSEEALQRVCGKEIRAFGDSLAQWAGSQPSFFLNPPPMRYEPSYRYDIDPRVQHGMRFSDRTVRMLPRENQ
jgi:tetratricopeptide (TPR) repeat protein